MRSYIQTYLTHIQTVRRYSPRTVQIYTEVLESYFGFTDTLTTVQVRNYQVHLMDDRKLSARTVNQHLSVLSGFSRFLMTKKILESNPVSGVKRPKEKKRLPEFYKDDQMNTYFDRTQENSSEDPDIPYEDRLSRAIISVLHGCALRRSELIGLRISDFDPARKVMRIMGKGNKMREIPVPSALCKEILLYLNAVETMNGGARPKDAPLFVTARGKQLYPVFVDRTVKKELSDIPGKKSPHVLRHTLATGLLNNGADLNSIKELLGHSSLAATQVYTHNSIAQLKKVYQTAHPRAKNGGKNGD